MHFRSDRLLSFPPKRLLQLMIQATKKVRAKKLSETPCQKMARPGTAHWHLYVIRTIDNTLYAGIATDVARRFEEHRSPGLKAAKYLLAHKPECIVFQKKIGSRSLALKVEYRFKHLPRKTKDHIVNTGSLEFDVSSGQISTRAGDQS